jgi:hypothetical protein
MAKLSKSLDRGADFEGRYIHLAEDITDVQAFARDVYSAID